MNILYVVHNLGKNVPESKSNVMAGGCEQFTYNMAHRMSTDDTSYILYPDLLSSNKLYLHKINNLLNTMEEEYDVSSTFEKINIFSSIIKEKNIDVIHYQHIIHCPIEYFTIAKVLDIPQIITFHDYYFVCEEHFLENDKYVTCNIPKNIEECCRCLFNKIKVEPSKVVRRRKIMTEILNLVDSVIVPSKNMRSDIFKIYPEINDKLHIVPVGSYEVPHTGIPQCESLVIGVPSYLTYIKGLNVVLGVIRICASLCPEVKFIILCDQMDSHLEKVLHSFPNVVLDIDGEYQGFEKINLTWIPSIAKETFSLIASETLQQGIPILCAKKGALESRLNPQEAFFYNEDIDIEEIALRIQDISNNMSIIKSKADYLTGNRDNYNKLTVDYVAKAHKRKYELLVD